MSSLVSEGGTGPGDQRPLNDREYALLQRLLSDPFSLPIEFKTWLISYLETSDLSLPMSSIVGLQSTLGISGAGQGTLGVFPAGLILPYGADAAPIGSKLCDGGSYARAAEQRLWTAIGLRYTTGDDGVSFNVPDMRARLPVMKGTIVEHDTLGKNDGLAVEQRSVKHRHTTNVNLTDPGHDHVIGLLSTGPDSGNSGVQGSSGIDGSRNTSRANTGIGVSVSVGTSGPLDTPAFMTINFIIVS